MRPLLKKLLVLLVLVLALFYFRESLVRYIPADNPVFRQLRQSISSDLTVEGVVKYTNQNRATEGLKSLTYNKKLEAAAKVKANDMFKNQYFEHESPSGKGPSDLADAAGYEYIVIGENLAEGNFKDDEELVTAWMNSPGHRANIMNRRFTEIGVAVVRGTFEGRQTWMAVQEFGTPLNSCPSVDKELEESISKQRVKVDSMDTNLQAQKSEIENMSQADPRYNQKVETYNQSVKEYNAQLAALKEMIDRYNKQVRAFNLCSQT